MPPRTTALSPAELDYLYTSLAGTSSHTHIRPDLRQPTDFRPLSAETGLLPAVNGSAHVRAEDGSEVIVGVKLEVEKTSKNVLFMHSDRAPDGIDAHAMNVDSRSAADSNPTGRPDWITLTLTLPGSRDDDPSVIALEETLREALTASISTPSASFTTSADTPTQPQRLSLQDLLPINTRYHWHIYIDTVLISSSHSTTTINYSPLPLLSIAIYLSLLDTRIPLLKSQGDEDPAFEDDWERSTYLYPVRQGQPSPPAAATESRQLPWQLNPPLTLLCGVIGDSTVLFDPTLPELAVADAVVAVSIGILSQLNNPNPNDKSNVHSTATTTSSSSQESKLITKIISLRTLDPPARDTFPGLPYNAAVAAAATATSGDPDGSTSLVGPNRSTSTSTPTVDDIDDESVRNGVWRPKVGGVSVEILKRVVREMVGDDHHQSHGKKGVVEELVKGLNGFVRVERERERERKM